MERTLSGRFNGDSIDRWIGDTLQSLARAARAEFGISGIVSALSTALQAPASVIDTRGSILASTPSRFEWQVDDIIAHDPATPDKGLVVYPLNVEGETVAFLAARIDSDQGGTCRFAADLISIELSRINARLEGRRELVGQILEDFFHARLGQSDAEQRLSEIGLSNSVEYRVIVGSVKAPQSRLRSFPWNLHTLVGSGREPFIRALINDLVVIIVPADKPVRVIAEAVAERLSRLGSDVRVGVGGNYRGFSGLRLSYYHARTSALSNLGVTEELSLNLSSILLLANLDLPLKTLSDLVLEPLRRYDEQNQGDLTLTLATYLRLDCSSQRASNELFVHRNTLRYRLDQIEQLTGRSLASFQNQMHFWLAIVGSGFDIDSQNPLSETVQQHADETDQSTPDPDLAEIQPDPKREP